jgi:hypothetical protein
MPFRGKPVRAQCAAAGRYLLAYCWVILGFILLGPVESALAQVSGSGSNQNLPTVRATTDPVVIGNIVSSNADPTNPFNGLVLNDVVGATRFYDQGFIGFNATIANVEAGSIWNGHETLTQVSTYVQDTVSPGPQTGEFDLHATLVGAVLAGRPALPNPGDYQVGIAPGADLWSGSIATQWEGAPYATGFDINLNTFANPYKAVMVTGVNGRTADVINSSWGFDEPTGAGSDFARGIDALVYISGKTFVTVAGNEGPGADTVGTPAAGYNKIAVGALTSDTSNPPYDTVADFSSRGPSDVFNPATNQIITGVRASVDIVAPGTDFTLAYYGGPTGGNNPSLGAPQGLVSGNNFYLTSVAGTSVAAPVVAGGAALVVDAARTLYGSSTEAIDGRVVKAILLNSADKIAGWNNGQAVNGSGVLETTQSLDYTSGAGALNLNRAYDQLTAGTTDVPGFGGGTVQTIGWDFGQVQFGGKNDYLISSKLAGGTTLTVTLDWFVNRTIDLNTNATAENEFSNLDLQVWKASGGMPTTLVATSDSHYNNVEHLSFQLSDDDSYLLRVVFAGENWNLSGVPDADILESYGLAWSDIAAVPEPASIVLLLTASLVLCSFSRRSVRTAP